jgi:prolyl oligopeptidase
VSPRRRRIVGPACTLLALLACGPNSYPPPPETRAEPVAYALHGVQFSDPYRWLERQDAPETRAWITAQNEYAEVVVGRNPIRDRFATRLRELTDRDDVGSPRRAGDFEYFTMHRSGEEAEVVYRRPAPEGESDDDPTVDGRYEVVLDPAELDPAYRTPVSMMELSPDGRLMMYSVRQGGADEIEVRIRDLATGQDLPDRLPDALYSGVEFDESGTGFYYTYRSRTDGPRIRHHTLGQNASQDDEVWGEGYGPTTFIGMDIVADGRYRIFTAQHGWARNDLFIQAGEGPVQPVVEGIQAHFQHRFEDGRLYVLTDWQAPNYRLMVVDPDAPSPESWTELIPESPDVLDAYAFIEGKIYVTYLQDVEHRVRVFEMDGTPAGGVEVPEQSTVSLRAGEDGKALLTVSGYLRPPTTFELDLQSGEREMSEPPEVELDASAYEVTKLWFESTGGARAPVYVMHQAGIELDGSHPTILNGYGGFNARLTPSFSATHAAWVEAGGVYAVATLRGGSEFGERWHRDGMLENKQRVFDDFIAAAEALIDAGYTSPEHLGISGASNGGLLVASAMTQRPDLFRAVLCGYPDLDMVRFFEFTVANNMPALLEYGDGRIPEQFEAIRRYSPYQAVRAGVDYPAVMLSTGDLDTRVPPLQARKMTAKLQAATTSGLPVILWYDDRGGHAAGRGRPTSMRIRDTARELAFMAEQLGLGSS